MADIVVEGAGFSRHQLSVSVDGEPMTRASGSPNTIPNSVTKATEFFDVPNYIMFSTPGRSVPLNFLELPLGVLKGTRGSIDDLIEPPMFNDRVRIESAVATSTASSTVLDVAGVGFVRNVSWAVMSVAGEFIGTPEVLFIGKRFRSAPSARLMGQNDPHRPGESLLHGFLHGETLTHQLVQYQGASHYDFVRDQTIDGR